MTRILDTYTPADGHALLVLLSNGEHVTLSVEHIARLLPKRRTTGTYVSGFPRRAAAPQSEGNHAN